MTNEHIRVGFTRSTLIGKGLRWKTLVFEGRAGETVSNGSDILEKIQTDWNCRIAAKAEIQYVENGRRICAVFLSE